MKKILPLIVLLVIGGFWLSRVLNVVETTQENAATELNNAIVNPLIEAVGVFDNYEDMLFSVLQGTAEERKGMVALLSLGGAELVEEALEEADTSVASLSYESGSPEAELYDAAVSFLSTLRELLPQYEVVTEKVLEVARLDEASVMQVFAQLQELQVLRGEAIDTFSLAQELYFE